MAPPNRTRSNRDSGTVSAAAVFAMCLTSGVTPAFSAVMTASVNASSWAGTDGCPGRSAQAKCDHRPTTWSRPRAWPSRAASTSRGQSARVAPPRLRPVSAFRCSRAGLPAWPAAAATWATNPAEPADRSMPWAIASAGAPQGHQAEHRGGDPGPPQRERLVGVHDPQPAGPAGQRRPGRRDHAVAVPVRLHHRHQLAAAHPLGQRGDVAGDRAQVDVRLPVHAPTGSGTRPAAPGRHPRR